MSLACPQAGGIAFRNVATMSWRPWITVSTSPKKAQPRWIGPSLGLVSPSRKKPRAPRHQALNAALEFATPMAERIRSSQHQTVGFSLTTFRELEAGRDLVEGGPVT